MHAPHPPTRVLRVLVVDDDADTAESLAELLALHGHSVHVAHDGSAALRHAEAEATLLLFCGTPNDPATPPAEQANVYATLTEVNHFSDPAVPFAAQYGADGPRILDPGQPFSCAYLLQMANRSPEALRDAVAHLGSYLFHELTTPLGLRLERSRKATPGLGGMTTAGTPSSAASALAWSGPAPPNATRLSSRGS